MNGIKKINLNTREGAEFLTFPDGQPHVRIQDLEGVYFAEVTCSISSPQKLLELQMVAYLLNDAGIDSILHIPYLMAARFDRVMQPGDSLDIKVIAQVINSLEFSRVYLYDPHSDVSAALINRSRVVTNHQLVAAYTEPNSVLIVPDAGAAKKASAYFEWNKNLSDIIYCIKKRDVSNGKLTLTVLDPVNCAGRPCVIIDDLCDGGRTFTMIADRLLPFNPSKLTLIVTHGIFSNGLGELLEKFNEIIVSDSYPSNLNSRQLKIIPYDPKG